MTLGYVTRVKSSFVCFGLWTLGSCIVTEQRRTEIDLVWMEILGREYIKWVEFFEKLL